MHIAQTLKTSTMVMMQIQLRGFLYILEQRHFYKKNLNYHFVFHSTILNLTCWGKKSGVLKGKMAWHFAQETFKMKPIKSLKHLYDTRLTLYTLSSSRRAWALARKSCKVHEHVRKSENNQATANVTSFLFEAFFKALIIIRVLFLL